MSEQYIVTDPVRGSDGEMHYPRVGVMSPMYHRKTGEGVYVIKLFSPVDVTDLVVFAQGAVPAKADAHAKADDPAKVGGQMADATFPFPWRPLPRQGFLESPVGSAGPNWPERSREGRPPKHMEGLAMSEDSKLPGLLPGCAEFLDAPDVVEISLNPSGDIFVERFGVGIEHAGRMEPAAAERFIRYCACAVRESISAANPIWSGRVPGTAHRIEALLPPLADGPAFSIRRLITPHQKENPYDID